MRLAEKIQRQRDVEKTNFNFDTSLIVLNIAEKFALSFRGNCISSKTYRTLGLDEELRRQQEIEKKFHFENFLGRLLHSV